MTATIDIFGLSILTTDLYKYGILAGSIIRMLFHVNFVVLGSEVMYINRPE